MRQRPAESRWARFTFSLAVCLGLPALLAIPALASAPTAGARYEGATSQHRTLDARVTSDGKGLQLTFDQVFACNRGPSKTTHSVYLEERPTILADGTFNYVKTYLALAPVPGFDERHTERQHVSGSFGLDGDSVRGRIADSVVGVDGLSCRSTVTFTARKTA